MNKTETKLTDENATVVNLATVEDALKAAKLMLVEETKKNFRLKDTFAEQFGKEFDEKEIEEEIHDRQKSNSDVDGSAV